jgi:hypothetical protein
MIKRENPPRPAVASWSPGPCGPARIYKYRPRGAGKGHQLSCLACFPRNCVGQKVPLTLGCSLVLCAEHRDPAFIASDSGRRFLSAVSVLYASLGLTSARFGAALRAFVERCANPRRHAARRHRPGSYAWPERRQDAERVWSRGGSYQQGLAAALARPPDGRGRMPTQRSVRRWWQDRRWLGPPPPAPTAAPAARGMAVP